MFPWINIVVSFIVTLIVIFLLKPPAIHIGLVDHPDERKQHPSAVPLIGGIAMFLGILFGMLTLPISLEKYRALIAAMGILVVIGVLDDFHELPPKSRLISQLVVGILIVFWGNLQISSFGTLITSSQVFLGILAIPVTLFAVMSLINAYNMIDGVDGLAGGITFVQIILLILVSYFLQYSDAFYLLLIIAASIFGFLIFNFPLIKRPAKIFMGDAGSMLLGVIMVWFAIQLTQGDAAILRPVTMLWIMSVPIFEIMAAVIRRIFKGKSPLTADRGHTHHRLMSYGLQTHSITDLMCLFSLVMGLIGIGFEYFGISDRYSFASFVILFFIYFFWLAREKS